MPLITFVLLLLLSTLRIRLKPGRIGHVAKGVQYYVNNSYRGLRAMVAQHKTWADRDVRKTKDNVLVITHWAKLFKYGFTDPHRPKGARVLGKDTVVEDMYWHEVRRLVAGDNYKIHRLSDDMNYCAKVGIWPKYEPKSKNLANTALWKPVRAQADRIAAAHKKAGKKRFLISGYALGRNASVIPHMRAAGIPTSRIKRW
jgi:glycerophosphoryl diester phosphodiesterase